MRIRRAEQEACVAAVRFKCDVLWAQLDALNHAYVTPGVIPPGAFRPGQAMTDRPAGRRYVIGPDSRPAFARYARLHRDQARERTVILGPERAYEVDAIGLAVLRSVRRPAQPRRDRRASGADLFGAGRDHRQGRRRVLAGPRRQAAAARRAGRSPRAGRFAAPTAYAPFAGGPAGLLAELTHRCPLQCPYCSNPLELERANRELTADEWGETFAQAAAMGALQLHLSGGEPTARRDLDRILAHARRRRPLHQPRHRGACC